MKNLIFFFRTQVAITLLLTSIALFADSAWAQSSLFNIPTSDVIDTGTLYLEADFDARLARYRDGGWQSYGVLGVYGVKKKVEIGMNAYLVRSSAGIEPIELQPNFKIKLFDDESRGLSLSGGAIAYLPVSRQMRSGSVASVYVVASKQLETGWAPRLSLGGYQLIGSKRDSGSKRGLLLGVEQPVYKGLSFIAGWNSGKNRFGYAAVGIGVAVTKRSYLSSAYYFGNESRSNDSFGLYYGMTF